MFLYVQLYNNFSFFFIVDVHGSPASPPAPSTQQVDHSISNAPSHAPPPYSDFPPPYNATAGPGQIPFQPPPTGGMGEPTVVCRVCQQLIFIRGREGQRVVKCSNCHEATVWYFFVVYSFIYFQIDRLQLEYSLDKYQQFLTNINLSVALIHFFKFSCRLHPEKFSLLFLPNSFFLGILAL